jgi:hypothetical protein
LAAGKPFFEVGRTDDLSEEGVGPIFEFHHDPFEGLFGLGDFEEGEVDGLVGAEHTALGDHEDQGIADVSGCACHGDFDRGGTDVVLGEMAPEGLQSCTHVCKILFIRGITSSRLFRDIGNKI